MLLWNKNAIIYGAGSSMGGSVAKAFASAGASELGVYGVRVVNIRSAGSPDSNVAWMQFLHTWPRLMEKYI